MPVGKRKKNGRVQWCADYVDSSGHRVQKFFPTKELAEDAFGEGVKLSRQKTMPDLPTTINLHDYSQHWLKELQAKQRTREAYTAHLNLYLLPTLGSLRLRDLQRGHIKALLVRQREALSHATVKLTLSTLRSMLSTAVDDELLVANPAAGLGRALRLSPRAAVRTEQIKAMDWAQRDLFLTTAAGRMPWWAPMWGVQVRTGCRPGEMYALEEADLDLDHRQSHIRRTLADRGSRIESTPKGNRARTIDLSAETVTILRKHLLDRKVAKLKFGWSEMPTPLFCSHAGTYANPSTVRREMRKVLRAAKLPAFSPHSHRHSFASLYLTTAEHPDLDYLKRQLGHASIQETVDTYGKWLKKSRPEALDCIDQAPMTAKKETA